ncbi:MAG: hypothetical protein ACRDIY_06320 [Chloroflexota bacterium]
MLARPIARWLPAEIPANAEHDLGRASCPIDWNAVPDALLARARATHDHDRLRRKEAIPFSRLAPPSNADAEPPIDAPAARPDLGWQERSDSKAAFPGSDPWGENEIGWEQPESSPPPGNSRDDNDR